MDIPLDEVVFFDCITSTPATGAAVNADSLPTFAVYEEATDTDIGIGGSMTQRVALTGNYRGTFTVSAANGFEVGKWYSVVASAVVGGVTGKAVLRNFRIVAAETAAGAPKVDVSHVYGTAQTAAPGAAGGLMIAGSNAATTLASMAVTGALTVGGGITVTNSTPGGHALSLTGHVAAGNGLYVKGGATAGNGIYIEGSAAGFGIVLDDMSVSGTVAFAGITASSLTLSGAFQAATIVSTGTTTLNALTITVNAGIGGTLIVTGATTLTGAVTAANASNNIVGVAAAATALSNLVWTDAKAGYLTGAVALEATLTAIKGAGWTTETLAAIDVLIDAIKAKTDLLAFTGTDVKATLDGEEVTPTTASKTGYALTSGERNSVADALLDRTSGIETGVTPRQAWQRIGAVVAGECSGAGTGTEIFVGLDGSTERASVTATSDGNRTAVEYDPA